MKKLSKIKYIIPFLIIIFIFSNSLKNGIESSNSSNFVTDIVYKIFKGDYNTLSYIVRKLAHFTEFFILGIFSYIGYKYYSLIFVVATAFLDELIQLFVEGRTSSIIDVLIDTSGGVLGIGLVILIIKIYNKSKQ